LELRHLRYFIAVAEELNFARAAARLKIAAPALSVQIRKLEEEIGVDLLAREGRGTKLTEAGRVFLSQARKSVADAQLGTALARQAAHGEIGHLSIGYNTATEFRVFPQIIPEFRKKAPNIHLAFYDLKTTQIIEGLRRDELDVGFVWLPIPNEGFDVGELSREPMVAVVPADHRLASAPEVSIKDLLREPIITFRRSLEPIGFQQIEDLFLAAGATMNVAYELESSPQMVNFVAMGLGCAVLPDYARSMRRDGVIYKTLKGPNVVKMLAVIKKSIRKDLAGTLFAFVMEHMQERTPLRKSRAVTVARRRR
jgi:DNA-binding transcriptional LysR family regulator